MPTPADRPARRPAGGGQPRGRRADDGGQRGRPPGSSAGRRARGAGRQEPPTGRGQGAGRGRPGSRPEAPSARGTGRPPRPAKPPRPEEAPDIRRFTGGRVARRGAAVVRGTPSRGYDAKRPAPRPQAGQAETWIDEGPVRGAAAAAVERGRTAPDAGPGRPRRAGSLPRDVVDELTAAAGTRRGDRLAATVAEARQAFDRDRYQEARTLLAKVVAEVPGSPAVRELYGLTLYRLGRWRQAAAELETFRTLTGSAEQHPVLADCYRALGRHHEVEALWQELREASPAAEIVAEGRIVMAGSLADRGELRAAIELLERATARAPKRVRPHHLRTWYVLADLYDRAGDAPRARTLFRRIQAEDAHFADVAERLAALGR